MKKVEFIYKMKGYNVNKFCKPILGLLIIFFVISAPAAEQPQQIISCANKYYLDYYTKLAKEVNRLIYVAQCGSRVFCPKYVSGINYTVVNQLGIPLENLPTGVDEGKCNNLCMTQDLYSSGMPWQDRPGGRPGVYDSGVDKLLTIIGGTQPVNGERGVRTYGIYYFDANNNNVYDDNEYAWNQRNALECFSNRSMAILMNKLRNAVITLYEQSYLNHNLIADNLTYTEDGMDKLPHLIEYDDDGNVLPGSLKLFPERSGDAAYMFTKIPTHLSDGTQIADSPVYAKNWDENDNFSVVLETPVLKIHFDEIREILNRNDFKWSLHKGKWSARGEDNIQNGSCNDGTSASDAISRATSAYNSSASSTDYAPQVSYGYSYYYDNNLDQDVYYAGIYRTYSYLSLPNKQLPYTRTVDFYVKGFDYSDDENSIFHANGDPVIEGKWNRFDQHSGSNSTDEYAKLGSLDFPEATSTPFTGKGYQIADTAIICKWTLPAIDITDPGPLYADVPDVDRDGYYDAGVNFDTPEFETGNFVHLPDKDSPQLFIPVFTDYIDPGNPKLWVYVGQGERKNKYELSEDSIVLHNESFNLTFCRIISADVFANHSDSFLYASGTSQVFPDIYWDDAAKNIHIRRLGVIRPNGQVVIFDFPWDVSTQKFSDIGYPTGIHKNRTYRLNWHEMYDAPWNTWYLCGKLSFDNDVVQYFLDWLGEGEPHIDFDSNYKYLNIMVGDKGLSNYYYNQLTFLPEKAVSGDPIPVCGMKYDFDWEWDEDYRLSKIYYITKDGKEKITVTLGYDSEGKVVKLTKEVPESMAVNGQTTYEISVNGNTITYPGGRTSTLTQTAAAGEARTVTITDTDPSSGTIERKYEYNDIEQLAKYIQTVNGKSAETSYTYYTGSGVYPNGSREDQKLESVKYPDGSWKYYEYDSNGFVAKEYTPDTGSGQTPGTSNNYTQYGYDQHEEYDYNLNWYEYYRRYDKLYNLMETYGPFKWFNESLPLSMNPGSTLTYFNGQVVKRNYSMMMPDKYYSRKTCASNTSGWEDLSNLSTKIDFYRDIDTNYTLYVYPFLTGMESTPYNKTSYTYSLTGPPVSCQQTKYQINLETVATVKDADGSDWRKIETLTNPRDVIESKVVTDLVSGQVISSEVSEVDSFGRIIKTTYLDGTTEQFENYCLWGPQTVIDREGRETNYVYRADGQLESIKTPQQVVQLSYDALGNITQRKVIANGKTLTETSTYDAQSRILSHTDAAGVTWNYQYNGQDVTMTGPDGKTRNIDYNPDGTIASITGNSVSPVFYEYGADGNGTWKKTIHGENAQAGIWEKEYYNMLGNLRREETSSGYSKDYTYDSKGRLVSTSDSNNNQMSQTYNGKSEVVSRTVNGTTTSYTYGYDTRENKTTYKTTSSTPSPYGSAITSEQEVSLDGLDSWSTVNNRTSHTVATRHGGGRYTMTTTDFEGTVTSVSNSANISNLTMSAPGLTAETQTDSFGRTISTKVRGQETKYNYDVNSGLLDKITGSDGKTTSISYASGSANPSQISLPGGYSVTPTFNKLDLLEKLTGNAPGNFDVTKSFDTLGRENNLATTGQPGTVNTTRSYNATTGALASKNISGVEAYNITYHNDGRINTISGAVDSGASVTKTLQYTAAPKYLFAGISYSDSTPDVSVSGHDSTFGLPSTVSTSGVITYALEYNSDLQLTAANVTSGVAGSKSVGYSYSNLRRSGMTLGGNTVSYQYDTAKRLLTVTSGDVEATYDYFTNSVNKIQKVTIKKGGQVVSTREIALESNSNRVASVTNKDGSGTVLNSFAYSYDAKGDISSITREDGSSWVYSYDKLGQLAGAQRSSDGVVRVGDTYKYEYDTITNVLKGGRTDVDGNFEFTATPSVFNNVQARMVGDKILVNGEAIENANIAVYAGTNATASVLASRKGKEFFATLDANNATAASGMLLNIIASYFDANATPEAGGDQSGNLTGADIIKEAIGMLVMPKQNEDPVYDDGGRMLLNSIYSCTWDGENRLTEVESQIKLDGTNRYKVTNAYDHAGRRIRKAVYTNDDSGWVLKRTHKYFYDTVRLGGGSSDFGLLTEEEVTDNSASTTTVYQYLWGLDLDGTYHGLGGVGGLLAVIDRTNGKVYVPQMDAKGSVYKYIDAEDGSVAAEFDYGPYGRVMHRTGSKVADLNLRYQTKYHDTEFNTYYYGLRHYDPTICRWLSRDPLEEQGGYNLYAFVNNDPINGVDYLGFVEIDDSGLSGFDPLEYNRKQQHNVGFLDIIMPHTAQIMRRNPIPSDSDTMRALEVGNKLRVGASVVMDAHYLTAMTGGYHLLGASSSFAAGAVTETSRYMLAYSVTTPWVGQATAYAGIFGQAVTVGAFIFGNDTIRGEMMSVPGGPEAIIYSGGNLLYKGFRGTISAMSAMPRLNPANYSLKLKPGLGSNLGNVGVEYAEPNSVQTEANQAVFWSGRKGANRAAAELYAQGAGKLTLEMTPGGKSLDAKKLFEKLPYKEAIKPWQTLSAEFATNASGEVTAYVGGANPGSIWSSVEFKLLMMNQNVTKIIIRDATRPEITKIIYK